jgi:hypothetical protein
MSGSLNLLPVILTASGTVTTDSTRIAGFTITNKSATDGAGIKFYQLSTDGSLGDEVFHVVLGSVGENGNQITQTYNGQTGIYFKNGVYASVDASCVGFITYF